MISASDNIIGVPALAFYLGIAAIVFTYGRQIMGQRFAKYENNITSKEVNHYLMGKGYVTGDIVLIQNTYCWEVEIIKYGKSFCMIVYTDGNKILDHKYKQLSVAFN